MNDKALLAVSFGTSVPGAEAAIAHMENALRAAFPERTLRRAYTSRIICRKLAREGRPVPSPEEALEELAAAGVRDVLIQPTHLTPGDEYDKLCRIAEACRERFEIFRMSKPLISAPEDLLAVADAVLAHYPMQAGEALLLMGHGSGHIANMIYPALQTAFRFKGAENVFVGTVEGWPELPDCLAQLKRSPWNRVELAPLMLVAGDHALNDMAGDEPDSWKSRLEEEGYIVRCHLEGVGMWDEICALCCRHARAATED